MMMQEHLIVPSEGGTNPGSVTGPSSSPLANSNRVALNVSLSSMTAMVGSPPPPAPNQGHLQSGGERQHAIAAHHIHHHSGGPPDNRYGVFGEKFESFQGVPSGLGSVGGVASVSSDASSSSSGGGLWQSHAPTVQSLQNNQQQITHLPNENEDLKQSQATGLVQRCGSNNSAAAATVNGHHQHPDLLPPGYIEHHQKVSEYVAMALAYYI